MLVLGFQGSPRRKGNTSFLLATFMQAAEKLGIPQVTYLEELVSLTGDTVRIRRNIGRGWEVVEARLPLLVTVLVRETVPVLINLLAIGRNGTALTTELGNMKIAGEVRVLDAQGIDPFIYLVMPRVLSLTLSVFCLAVLFVVVAFTSSYLSNLVLSPSAVDPGTFVHSIVFSVSPVDLINFLSKTIIPALFTGAICCSQGLRVQTSLTEVTKSTKRALTLSVRALFGISALVSLLTYK